MDRGLVALNPSAEGAPVCTTGSGEITMEELLEAPDEVSSFSLQFNRLI